jgi:hypothetical protein
MPEPHSNRLAPTYSPNFRRDHGRGFSLDMNNSYDSNNYVPFPYGSDSTSYRHFERRDEPPQKRQRRDDAFPDVDTRYVLGSNRNGSQSYVEDPTTPHSATAQFSDSYFSQYATQTRTNASPSRTYMGRQSKQYPYGDPNQYPTPDSSRGYYGHSSNSLSTGSELATGFAGSTEPGRHHYPSSAETQSSIPAPTAMHPPVLSGSRPSPMSDSRYWQGSFENSALNSSNHSRASSSNAIPTGHLLPAPLNLQSRSTVEM